MVSVGMSVDALYGEVRSEFIFWFGLAITVRTKVFSYFGQLYAVM